jgi:integrase
MFFVSLGVSQNMPTKRLTNKFVENAKAVAGKRLTVWDSVIGDDVTLSGSFGLRISERGTKTWVAMYRVDDERNPAKKKQRFLTIGPHPAIGLGKARELCRDALKKAGQGTDPIEEEKKERAKRASIYLVDEAVDQFIKRYAKRQNRSWQQSERILSTYLIPKFGDRPLPSISPQDINAILDDLMDADMPYMANRTLAQVRKFFNWCKNNRHWIEFNPTDGIDPPGKEEPRDRVLEKKEIAAVWNGCDQLGWPFGPLIRLLLLTGQRRDEVARMKWEDLDFETRVWTLPKKETKSDRLHAVPLSRTAVDILQALPRNGEFVLSTNGKTPISGFGNAKARLDKICEISDWRIHDLRRTVASGMAEIAIAPHVIEKILNHSTGQISGVAAIYNRHAYLQEKTEALNAWANALGAINGHVNDTVVELHTVGP